jgi:hypothetical protein
MIFISLNEYNITSILQSQYLFTKEDECHISSMQQKDDCRTMLFCCRRAWLRPERTLLHELGRSVVALHYKVPVSTITLFVFGGVAQIEAEPPSAGAKFWIALTGMYRM